MSEWNHQKDPRSEELYLFAKRLILGDNGKSLVETYQESIQNVNAFQTMQVLNRLLADGFSFELVKANVGKIINVFFKSLNSFVWDRPEEGHFLYYLMLENRAMEKLIEEVRPSIKVFMKSEKSMGTDSLVRLRAFVRKASEYELHYIKKENILFPVIEKTFPQYRCLQLMWSFHDDYRKSLKNLEMMLQSDEPDRTALSHELGRLFFVVIPIVFREEQIVYPVALRSIPGKTWSEMLAQSKEVGWCFGIAPDYQLLVDEFPCPKGMVHLGNGALDPEHLILLLDHLPVDITLVDENDEVLYFSGSRHRIFPRSKAIIGRKVQNCHPPESVHVVNDIVSAFRDGAKDVAEFWIQMKGRFIHIRYFALRNEQGDYKGVIEVSQDVTDIRNLQGEQRLLDWEK